MLAVPLSVIAAHCFGDWILQSNAMAMNKSKHNGWLTIHVLVVAICLLPFGWKFALINFWLHWLTDYITSRMTSKWWFIPMEPIDPKHLAEDCPGPKWSTHYAAVDGRKRGLFFKTIGVDQLIHYVCYALTFGI